MCWEYQERNKKVKNRTVYFALMALVFSAGNFSFASDDKQEPKEAKASVVVTASKQMAFEDRVETSGNLETRRFSIVSARTPGIIDSVFVREGDQVDEGKTRLFQIDKIKSSQAIDIAKQAVSVSEHKYRAKLATVKRLEADLDKAKTDYERFERLYNNDAAVTKDALESQKSRYIQTKAAYDEARANADLSEKELEQERGRLIMARKDFENSMGVSPISGYVSKRLKEPGEMVGAGTPIVRIDDLSVLEVSAYLPAVYYQEVIIEKTKMKVTVGRINIGGLPVIYKSPVIDSRLRNFEIKALIKNPQKGITSGDIAGINVILSSHEGIGVPREAVLKKSSGAVLFAVEKGKAKMFPVRTGLENDGWIEILSKDVKKELPVVTMGQDRLFDGTPVSVLKGE